jgi:CheY-like chemotaxis protein
VYALGVVAYECLAGRRPFEGDNPLEVATRQLRETPPPLPAQVPPAVRRVVETAMAKDPGMRYPSAAAMATAARHAVTAPEVTTTAAPEPGHAAGLTASLPPTSETRDPDRIRVLVVDDHALVREALAMLLDAEPNIEVVGQAGNGEEALRRAAEVAPDVVLMDLRMPVLDGVVTTRRMRTEQPNAKVIALTTSDDDEDVFAVLRAGAVGYLLKDLVPGRFVEAVLAAARGESVLQPSIAAKLVARLADNPTEA